MNELESGDERGAKNSTILRTRCDSLFNSTRIDKFYAKLEHDAAKVAERKMRAAGRVAIERE